MKIWLYARFHSRTSQRDTYTSGYSEIETVLDSIRRDFIERNGLEALTTDEDHELLVQAIIVLYMAIDEGIYDQSPGLLLDGAGSNIERNFLKWRHQMHWRFRSRIPGHGDHQIS